MIGIQEVLDGILNGAFDDDFDRIYDAIKARQKLRNAAKLLEFKSGDRIRVSKRVSPKYLAGSLGTVVTTTPSRVTIKLDDDNGRFSAGTEIGFHPATVELIEST